MFFQESCFSFYVCISEEHCSTIQITKFNLHLLPKDNLIFLHYFKTKAYLYQFYQYKLISNNVRQKTDKMETLTKYTPTKISIPTSKGAEFIDIKDIVRIEADRSYSMIYLTNGRKLMVSRCLNEYDSMLNERKFFRIHNSHLINLEQVKLYIRGDGGSLEMNDTSNVPIARLRKDAFLESMQSLCL